MKKTLSLALPLAALLVLGGCFSDKTPSEPDPAEVALPVGPQKGYYINDPVVRWIVPDGTKKVTVRIMAPNGAYITEYEISNYISLSPGQRIMLKAE